MKKRHPRTPGKNDNLDEADQAAESCENIATFAELLITCGSAGLVNAKMISRVGWLIFGETEKLNQLQEKLQSQRSK